MIKRLILVLALVATVVAAVPVAAVADVDDVDGIYLSLGDSLAHGSLANADGSSTVFPTTNSYTDRLYSRLADRHPGLTHVKLGCDGEKTTDMITGAETKCSYVTGTQLGDAMGVLAGGDVVLVTINIGANDLSHAAGVCNLDPGCIQAESQVILGNLAFILGSIRATGYAGPIVGMNYYNPNVAASVGFFAGAPGPLAPDPGFAALSDALVAGFNGGLATVYGWFGVPVADVYDAFHAGDFGDDGGSYQKAANGVPDNADAVCRLTSMCPDDPTVRANIHPTPKGYKVIAGAFWEIVGPMDLVTAA